VIVLKGAFFHIIEKMSRCFALLLLTKTSFANKIKEKKGKTSNILNDHVEIKYQKRN